jgi:hypothetical protein
VAGCQPLPNPRLSLSAFTREPSGEGVALTVIISATSGDLHPATDYNKIGRITRETPRTQMAQTHHRIPSTSTSTQPAMLAMRASHRLERTTPNTDGFRDRPCTAAGHPSPLGVGDHQPAYQPQRMQPHARQRPADSAATVLAMGPGRLVKRCAATTFTFERRCTTTTFNIKINSEREGADLDYKTAGQGVVLISSERFSRHLVGAEFSR